MFNFYEHILRTNSLQPHAIYLHAHSQHIQIHCLNYEDVTNMVRNCFPSISLITNRIEKKNARV